MNNGSNSIPKRNDSNGKIGVNKPETNGKTNGTNEDKTGKPKVSRSDLVGDKKLVKGKNVASNISSGSRFDVLHKEVEDMSVGEESQGFNKGSIDPTHREKSVLAEITNIGKEVHRDSLLRGGKGGQKRLNNTELAGLSMDICEQDVRQSLFGIGGLKAPGPDSFLAIFF
ncbi:hypothetical protein QYF36_021566 [Acer negundo]|nr:hypothetical protein QYF36_021566 [Acer negundo]